MLYATEIIELFKISRTTVANISTWPVLYDHNALEKPKESEVRNMKFYINNSLKYSLYLKFSIYLYI